MSALAALDGWGWLAVLAIFLAAGWVHGTLGLGFPLLATPALAAMMDVRSAILVTLLPTMAVNLASIAGQPGGVSSARRFGPLLAFVLAGSILGSAALATFDPAPFRLALALLILLYLWGKARIPAAWLSRHPGLLMGLFGVAAGIAAGTTNAMVTVLIIYFLSLETPRTIMVPALNACFFTGKVAQASVLAVAGFVSVPLLWQTGLLALAAVLALLAGQRVQARINAAAYRRMLQALLLLLAVILLTQYFAGSA